MDIVKYLIENSTYIIETGGILTGFLLVFIECFIPALPLSVFVALNVNAFGFFIGCIISWLATSLGSYICYKLFYFLGDKITRNFLNRKFIKRLKDKIDKFKKIKFTELALIITLPFTPSSLINILCGITNMSDKKFIGALLIGKFFSIFFWGYVGKSIIKNLTDLDSIIYVVITLIIAYIISKLVSKKLNIE